ncbi:LexA family transcriptional regulator [Dyadobacter sp. CY261]|uniref:XRE family transcriptional regulator n=1 Tax=Dyadobacter sp. CY261 TaxID=2907203 RepID=UPI001F3DB1AA|nr:LexA family transcriptional regulator [Dyadobacter sp. CY261]MCF0073281.1 LexA family transcriptional regulator [Dyadobacter sp. CY261]
MAIDEEYRRFKQVREELNLTQSAFAEELGISATTADIERGRTRIPGQVVKELLKKYHINPLWLFGDSSQKYLYTDRVFVNPKVVTVDQAGKDNIVLVSAKAAAGYPNNIGDAQWFESLPAFTIPLPEYRNATFRGFQVDGDSMMPALQSGEWIWARAVDDWDGLSDKNMYVIVTVESVLVKKLRKEKDSSYVNLISLNPDYAPIRVDRNEIREVWQVNSKLSFDLEADKTEISLLSLHQEMRELRQEMKKLVK